MVVVMDLLTQVTQDYVPIATETMQGMVSSSNTKKLLLISVPSNITAESLDNATIRDGQLITEKNGSFICNIQPSEGSFSTVPVHNSETGATKFTLPDQFLQVLKPLDETVANDRGRKRKFITTKPPPVFPTGLKVRYQLFGSGRPEDPLPPVLPPCPSDDIMVPDDIVVPDDVTMTEELEPPTKMHKKHKKEKKKKDKSKDKGEKKKKDKKKKKKDKKSKDN